MAQWPYTIGSHGTTMTCTHLLCGLGLPLQYSQTCLVVLDSQGSGERRAVVFVADGQVNVGVAQKDV